MRSGGRNEFVVGAVVAVGLAVSSCSHAHTNRPVQPAASSLPTLPRAATTDPTSTAGPTPSTSTTGAAAVVGSDASWRCAALPINQTLPGTHVAATVADGAVKATLAGQVETPSFGGVLASPTLTIVDGSGSQRTQAVTPPPNSFGGVRPEDLVTLPSATQPAAQPSPLCVARFSSAGPPVVLLGLTLGGAHCCTVIRAYVVGSAAVTPVPDENLGNPSAALESSNGASILVTADNAFAYEFDSFAGSAMPVKVVTVVGNQFGDVTREHLDLVRSDAAMWWSLLQKTNDTLGLVAAWVADQCELGQEPSAWATVSTLQGQGRLGPTVAGPGGAAFVSHLHAFLSAHRYCST